VLKTAGFSRDIFPQSPKRIRSDVHIWGEKDCRRFEQMTFPEKKKFLNMEMGEGVAVMILTEAPSFPAEVIRGARRRNVALFKSDLSKTACRSLLENIASDLKHIVISGGLLEIFDMGVLIIGDSGIGKSESALELISRGHRFISDDVTECRIFRGRLVGSAPEISRHFMELRGLGIINIREIFGPKAICRQVEINLVIELQRWKEGKEYDRMGIRFPHKYEILSVMVPQIRIPVAPGRNISNLIEVACKVHALRERGYHASQEITKRLDRALSAIMTRKKRYP